MTLPARLTTVRAQRDSAAIVAGFVDELATDPALIARILVEHTRDERGRCEGCALDDRSRPLWPCGPRRLADGAARVRAAAGARRAG